VGKGLTRTPTCGDQRHDEGGHLHQGLRGTEDAEHPHEQGPGEEVAAFWWPAEHARVWSRTAPALVRLAGDVLEPSMLSRRSHGQPAYELATMGTSPAVIRSREEFVIARGIVRLRRPTREAMWS